jgi:hypothetical protein
MEHEMGNSCGAWLSCGTPPSMGMNLPAQLAWTDPVLDVPLTSIKKSYGSFSRSLPVAVPVYTRPPAANWPENVDVM